ncbi:hypothetical protein PUNSTDRAFT_121543 [Punctularia strigosozonata HHB-11173 SS5]|uniref:uncharacterized protein n=1 Tax=Punctularia strigosozonata (strain HHB-11173) TaxID=741275 RepID=UPI0004417D8C|nr:uncharacterized protein PUNSTDRAFT_121543 [Punctularia strigosozonata HHB-11173 SS5]EIN07431.1 hypothetical protein PUNSTDRAFT_121543 [Punctularia strigosozonata HHB-11173 SS5]
MAGPGEHESRKRKQPPTFQHLPPHRAKKLKKEWIEKQKIKSKWRAQKRKEGLATSLPCIARPEGGEAVEEDSGDEPKINQGKTVIGDHASEPDPEEEPGAGSESEDDQSENDEAPSPATSAARRSGDKAGGPEGDTKETPSLRELSKQAYSRSSLHSYKSDPLHRHGRGGGRGGGAERSDRGGRKGQPDMRLRMNAMLEKIKRDHT